jgi:creatinine amidohydrolase
MKIKRGLSKPAFPAHMKQFLPFLLLVLLPGLSSAQIFNVQDMSTTEIAALDRAKTVVLLPGGILEEHGPYLPAFTDGYMNVDLTRQVANTIAKRPGMKVLIFPLIPLGSGGANEIARKYSFPGTYAVRMNTLRALLMDVSSELGEQGFKKVFVIHMHGGPDHNLAIDQACGYFNDTYQGRMVNIWNLAVNFHAPPLTDAQRKEDGFTVHSGTDEHSILYYLKPDFQRFKYQAATPVIAAGPGDLATVARKEGWPGYWGSPRQATVAQGEKVWKAWMARITEQVTEVLDNKYDFTKPTFYEMMRADPFQKTVNEDALKHDQEIAAKQAAWLKSKGIDN